MKKITAALGIAYAFAAHHNASGMLIIKSLSKNPKAKQFFCQQNNRKPWTDYYWNRPVSYGTRDITTPLFEAHEELYQTMIKNHAEHNALLQQIIDNQDTILKDQTDISETQAHMLAKQNYIFDRVKRLNYKFKSLEDEFTQLKNGIDFLIKRGLIRD